MIAGIINRCLRHPRLPAKASRLCPTSPETFLSIVIPNVHGPEAHPRRKDGNWAFALSPGERVDRDPDALHRDAGRVRGHSLISAPPEPSSPRWLPALCARTPLDPPTPTRSESAASLCREFSNNRLSQRLSAFGWAASAHRLQARSPVDVRSSRNRQPSFRCGLGGEISRPAFGHATNTMPLFQLPFGCAAVRGPVAWGCARAKYNGIANGCEDLGGAVEVTPHPARSGW